MLTLVEKILFVIVAIGSLYLAYVAFGRMFKVIGRGQGKLDLKAIPGRLWQGVTAMSTAPVFKTRLISSIFHAFVAWGFILYFLVNTFDVLAGYIHPFHNFLNSGAMGVYRLLTDIFSVAVLVGVAYFLIRRFIAKSPALSIRDNVKLHPKALHGMRRDSLIVGLFILFHVGFRFLGESFLIAHKAHADVWQPFASGIANLWAGLGPSAQLIGWHICWWIALGLILAFIPYFPYTKHLHLIMSPLNFMTRPERRSIGELDALDFDDESIEQFGAANLSDLTSTQLLDSFACIMCNRCQDVCPAYTTGKELSPSALEINKRYAIKEHFTALAEGAEDPLALMEFAISESAVWACTTCGACAEICPVGNEPFRDILDIRRNLTLMESQFPHELQAAFRGMERNGNPWQMSDDRMAWTEALDFKTPTVEENPDFEILYWVGCAGAFDPGAQEIARSFATILNKAGVNFAVLGNEESCTGDAARRAGNEYLFFEMASMNVEILNKVKAKKIVASCPHCLHTIKNEYPQFGGEYEVIHHTELINDLVGSGQVKLKSAQMTSVTFHDPCYLGRHNGVYEAPRNALKSAGLKLVEMERNRSQSFCCGAGGAQMWKEEEHGVEAVNKNRYLEAQAAGVESIAVGCPFCNQMLSDANTEEGGQLQVRDVAEIVADALA